MHGWAANSSDHNSVERKGTSPPQVSQTTEALMWISNGIAVIALVVLNRLGNVNAKLSGVVKPAEKLTDEDFLKAVAGRGSRRLTLGTCQSDCDYDSDCNSGLVCWQRRTSDPLPPCCSGSQPSDSRDFCVPSSCSSGSGGGGTGGGGDTSIDVGIVSMVSLLRSLLIENVTVMFIEKKVGFVHTVVCSLLLLYLFCSADVGDLLFSRHFGSSP